MKKISPSFSILLLACLLLFSYACQPSGEGKKESEAQSANEFMHQRSFDDLVAAFEDPARMSWQKPDAVIDLLGEVKGKTIMDIGCGTGYFAFRLVEAGAQVICADVDSQFLAYVREKKLGMEEKDSLISLKKVPYDSPDMEKNSVDEVMIVNTYHHIENRTSYFKEVKEGLKEEGRLMVVDFLKVELPEGPPMKMKLSAEEVMEELREAGFVEFEVNEELLPYQYIILAS